MRLIDIKSKINEAKENLDFKCETSSGNYYLRNVQKAKIVLSNLVSAGFIDVDNSSIFKMILSSEADSILISHADNNTLVPELVKIGNIVDALYYWINNYVVTTETETTINIKLPKVTNLNELQKTIDLLNDSLNTISIINGGGGVKVEQLDHGSFWLIVALSSVEVVKALGKAVAAVFDIAKQKVELDQAKETLKRAKIENKMLESYSQMQEAAIQQLINDYSNQLEKLSPDKAGGLEKNERIVRYKTAIQNLTNLVCSGTEFHPALTASQEIIDQFPVFDKRIEFKAPIANLPINENNKNEKNEEKKTITAVKKKE